MKSRFRGKKLLLLGILLFGLSVATWAQKVSLNCENVELQEVLLSLKKQTGYGLVFSDEVVDVHKKVSIKVEKEELSVALTQLLKDDNVTFEIKNKKIYLMEKRQKGKASAASKKLSGVIVDENGIPIIGASIMVKGTTNGTIADIDGNYTLQDVPADAIISISYIGYKTLNLKVGSKDLDKIVMKEDTEMLDEVIVVGYGTQKKANLTGAVATVSQEVLKDRPVANVGGALQGLIPNLNVTFSSGQPGAGASYNIRGTTSPNGGDPLVLVDGVESSLEHVNPGDIESVTVLKDASSAAIYGARGAFGVILVTTKSGHQNEKAQVSYNGSFSISTPTTSTEYETRGYYSAKIADFFTLSSTGQPYTSYTESDYEAMWERRNDKTEHPDRPWVTTQMRNGKQQYVYLANFDWYNYMYDDSRPTWNHGINVSGGSKALSYMLSGRYYTQKGVNRIQPDRFQSYNFLAKFQAEITPWLKLTSNTKFYSSTYNYYGYESQGKNFRSPTLHALASFVPQNPDGSSVFYHTNTANAGHTLMDGYAAMLQNGKNKGHKRNKEFSTTFEVAIQLHKALNVKADFTYTSGNTHNDYRMANAQYSQYPGIIATESSNKYFLNNYKESLQESNYYVANVYATYQNSFAQKHNLTVLGGYNYEAKDIRGLTAANDGLLSEELSDFNLAKGDNFTLNGGQNEYAIMGLFYRVAYDYQGKYLAEANGRYDGTSRFPRGKRFGFFPSFSAAYRISEEPFFEPLRKTIDNLKLRLSYGSLGNQQIGYYDFVQTISTQGNMNYTFDGTSKAPHATVSDPVSSNQTWEKVISKNIGLDLNMLRNRLSFTAEFYIRDTEGILGRGKSLPSIYGANEPQVNSNDLRTKGYELTLGWNDQFTLLNKPFKYGVSLSFSDYTAEYVKCDNPSGLLNDPYEGKKYGEIWGYIVDGLFASDEEAAAYGAKVDMSQAAPGCYNATGNYGKGIRGGDPRYLDLNDDGIVNGGKNTLEDPGDRRIIGNSTPRYHYGINANFSWNNIDFSAFFQGIGKLDWYPGSDNSRFWGAYCRPYQTFIPKNFMSDVWSEDNPDAYYPRARAYASLNTTNGTVYYTNSRYLQNLAYCRLKNLTVGYTLPKQLSQKAGIQNLRVYVSGENLITWTALKNKFLDPEQAAADGNKVSDVYPWSKTYSVGINVTF